MLFAPGDRVHLTSIGTGVVREARNGGRYLIEIKGRTLVVEGSELQPAAPERQSRRRSREKSEPAAAASSDAAGRSPSLDLHGHTIAEALEALDAFLNDALLEGRPEVRVIHGRSGGAVKAAVHKRLGQLPPVRSFRIDPRNPGVTIVSL
jgi:DNA mismatch repair protein MutS2